MHKFKSIYFSALIAFTWISEAVGLTQDQLALTPPMGWDSYNYFASNAREKGIQGIADAMASSGMRDAGYQYIIIEEFWKDRDANGVLRADSSLFPSGMKAIGDYIHSKGLKFGIYQDAGTQTCAGGPGIDGHEIQDAQLFASWGVDYLKEDYCKAPGDSADAHRLYKKMGDALRATGRPILFSICEWGQRKPWLWGKDAGGQMWRTTYDVQDTYYGIDDGGGAWLNALEYNVNLAPYAGPGGWNDPDMLVVGLYGKGDTRHDGENDVEYQSQMSIWCMLAAPLITSHDVRTMNQATKDILLNPEILAIDQDSLGKQGTRVFKSNESQVWKKELRGGDIAVCLFNQSDDSIKVVANWKDLKINGSYRVRDLWKKKDLGNFNDSLSFKLEKHASMVFRLSNGVTSLSSKIQYPQKLRGTMLKKEFRLRRADGKLLKKSNAALIKE